MTTIHAIFALRFCTTSKNVKDKYNNYSNMHLIKRKRESHTTALCTLEQVSVRLLLILSVHNNIRNKLSTLQESLIDQEKSGPTINAICTPLLLNLITRHQVSPTREAEGRKEGKLRGSCPPLPLPTNTLSG